MLEFKDMAFQTAVTAGWNWHCISSAVEASVPWLPEFLQGSLNSSNHIAGKVTEMELCLSVAANYKRVEDMETAVGMVRSSSSVSYLDAVANYVKAFAGGETFPLIHLLVALEKLFNSSLLLGEEFFTAIAMTDVQDTE